MNTKNSQSNIKRPAPFSSYCGLEEIVVLPENFSKALEDRITKSNNNNFKLITYSNKVEDYNTIRICDTFFSDAFPESELKRLIQLSFDKKELKLKFRFLLLNPLSTIAKIRANALEKDSFSGIYRRINEGLRNILNAIKKITNDDYDYHENRKSEKIYTKDLLQQIKEEIEERSIDLEIKFTEEYTDLPYYMIGFYVFKGMIFPDKSASQNPWSIYVDDPHEDRDTFSTLKRWFDILWDRAIDRETLVKNIESLIDRERTIFLSHGGKNIELIKFIENVITEVPYREIYEINYLTKYFEQDFKEGKTTEVPSIWHDRINQCSAAIVLLLTNDSCEGKNRARQNVIHELGYLQALFGVDRVLVILEQDLDFPQNIENQRDRFFYVSRNSGGNISPDIFKNRIRQFLSKLN